MVAKHQILNLLKKLNLKSPALQVRHGTLLSNLYHPELSQYLKFSLPPTEMMNLVAGTTDKHRFVWSGRLTVARMIDLLQISGVDLDGIDRLLDFGCGCGRLTSHLLMYFDGKEVYGSDTDHEAITWCQANLTSGRFALNSPMPPLSYSDHQFDLITSYSVFTHIHVNEQESWLKELNRIIAPGGYLLFSTQGYKDFERLAGITNELRQAYQKGEMVSIDAKLDYVKESNYGTYHPCGSIERLAEATGFRVLNTFLALKAPPLVSGGHNLHLLQKTAKGKN